MANTKISAFTSGAPAQATDEFVIARAGANYKLAGSDLKTLAVGAGAVSVTSDKTLTVSNTLTLAGTDGTTMTFPSTSATLARTDAGNTFTGSQTLSGDTVTTSSPVIDAAQTWNAGAVTFTGLKFTATDTASAALSRALSVGTAAGGELAGIVKDGHMFGKGFWGSAAKSYNGSNFFGIDLSTSDAYSFYMGGTNQLFVNASGVCVGNAACLGFSANGAAANGFSAAQVDVRLTRKAAASLRLGAADAAAPVAQTLGVQSVVAGTTNTAGADWTFDGSQGTGTGAGGSLIFRVAPAGSSGSAQNALATALTIDSTKLATFAANVVIAGNSFSSSGSNLYLGDSANSACVGISGAPNAGVTLKSDGVFRWTNGTAFGGTADLFLYRDAANTLALRNGANAQAFRVYNTFTDASNYERGVIAWVSNDLKIGTENAGTGSATRQTHIYGGGQIRLYTGNTLRWYADASGNFLTGTDNAFDIGAAAATRPRNIYAATSITGPHNMTGTAPASASATGTAGDVRYDADYIYVCTAANTWKRAAIATW